MIDIKVGDLLVVGDKEYPIKACSDWVESGFSTASFASMASLTASTKREDFDANGKSTHAINLTGLSATPLDPVSDKELYLSGVDTPHELLQTFIADRTGFVHLYIQDVKS